MVRSVARPRRRDVPPRMHEEAGGPDDRRRSRRWRSRCAACPCRRTSRSILLFSWSQGEAYLPAEHPASCPQARLPAPHVDPSRSGDREVPSPPRSGPPVGLSGSRRIVPGSRVGAQGCWNGSHVGRCSDGSRRPLPAIDPEYSPSSLLLAESEGHGAGLAMATSRRVGPAVVRNRLRRQIRAVSIELDRERPWSPGWYLVIVHPSARGRSSAELGSALADVLHRAGVRP